MNRNVDGSPLTQEQLLQIASDAGLDMGKLHAKIAGHGEHMAISHLKDATAAIRLDLFNAGHLSLDTRTERNSNFEPDEPRERKAAGMGQRHRARHHRASRTQRGATNDHAERRICAPTAHPRSVGP